MYIRTINYPDGSKRKVACADEGKRLVIGEEYIKESFLADGVDESAYHEITEDEYVAIMAAKEAEEQAEGERI